MTGSTRCAYCISEATLRGTDARPVPRRASQERRRGPAPRGFRCQALHGADQAKRNGHYRLGHDRRTCRCCSRCTRSERFELPTFVSVVVHFQGFSAISRALGCSQVPSTDLTFAQVGTRLGTWLERRPVARHLRPARGALPRSWTVPNLGESSNERQASEGSCCSSAGRASSARIGAQADVSV
jgi:hypothetical protein